MRSTSRNGFDETDRAVVERRVAPHQKGAAFDVSPAVADQALEHGLLVPVELIDRRPVIRRSALPFRARGVQKPVLATLDISAADFLTEGGQLFLARSLVEDEENIDLVECLDRLNRDVFRVSRPDTDDEDLLHGKPFRDAGRGAFSR